MAQSKRVYPHVGSIKDFDTRQSMQRNWDETFTQRDQIEALQATVAALQSALDALTDRVTDLEGQINQNPA